MIKSDDYEILKTLSSIPSKGIILFGSHARGTECIDSDYDILIIVEKVLQQQEKYTIAGRLQRSLAKNHIDADIIIKSEDKIEEYKDLRGSIVRNALMEGVPL